MNDESYKNVYTGETVWPSAEPVWSAPNRSTSATAKPAAPPISAYTIEHERPTHLDIPFADIFWIVLKVEVAIAIIGLVTAAIVLAIYAVFVL